MATSNVMSVESNKGLIGYIKSKHFVYLILGEKKELWKKLKMLFWMFFFL